MKKNKVSFVALMAGLLLVAVATSCMPLKDKNGRGGERGQSEQSMKSDRR